MIWLGLGANEGDRQGSLRQGLRRLMEGGVAVEAVSGLYATAPQGVTDQPGFLNAACRVRTSLGPRAVLALAKRLEAEAGRGHGPRWAPRPLDIDLLVWAGGEWNTPDLVIPHPRLHERRFALVPLVEVDPGLVLPSGARIADLLARIPPDSQPVTRVGAGGHGSWATAGLG